MTINELKALVLSNFDNSATVNFADKQSATINAIVDFYELDGLSPREIKQYKPLIMALIEEAIDEKFPEKLENRIGDFAEIKQYARDAEVVFNIKGKGKRRAFLTIKKGARGGMYQSARLDDAQMTLPTWTETVAVFVTLEEILLGKYSLVELMNNILDGFVERMYIQVVEALQAATVPAANQASAAGIDNAELDGVIRVVAAYGRPTIVGFHNVISKINNAGFISSSTPNVPTSDLDEIKNKGYVGIYKGTPIIKLPNYILDENTNATWALDENKLFILPTEEKPVKIALKGEMQIQEVVHPTGSAEWNAHKILGIGLLLTNNIGIYTDTDE